MSRATLDRDSVVRGRFGAVMAEIWGGVCKGRRA